MMKKLFQIIVKTLGIYCVLSNVATLTKSDCSYPRNAVNAIYTPYRSRYRPNETVTYSCQAGYGTIDPTINRCLNTTWDLVNLPRCYLVCNEPGAVRYSIVMSARNGTPHFIGDEVTYECQPPLLISLTAPVKSLCQADQTWTRSTVNDNLPNCYCPPYPSLPYGFGVPPSAGPYQTVTYKCDPNFVVVGDITTNSCDESGVWDLPIIITTPRCRRACNDAPAVIPGATALSNDVVPFDVNDTYVYTCNDVTFTIFPNVSVCKASFDWSLDASPPRCVQTRCSPPVTTRNGAYKPIKPYYNVDDEVTYFCNNGFATADLTVSRCEASLLWSLRNYAPKCNLVCEEPPSVPNTRITGDTPPYFPGEIITYRCIAGLSSSRDSTVNSACLSNLKWSYNAIEENFCNCPAAPVLANGTYTPAALRAPGEGIQYTCLPGFQLIGKETSNQCLRDGDWEFPFGPPGTRCIEDRPLWCLNCNWKRTAPWYGTCYDVTHHSATPEAECNYPPSAHAYCLTKFVIIDDRLYSISRGCQAGLVLKESPAEPTCVTESINEISGVRTAACYFACNHFYGCNDVTADYLSICEVNCGIHGRCNYLTGRCVCSRGYAGQSCSVQIDLFYDESSAINPTVSKSVVILMISSATIRLVTQK